MNIAPIILTVITILNPLSAPTAPPEPVGQQAVTNVFQQQGLPYPKQGEQVWDNLAQCESGGNWHINTANGFSGGLQFAQTSWNAVRGNEFAPTPHQATREQQITAGERLQAVQGWGAWPACSAQLRLQ